MLRLGPTAMSGKKGSANMDGSFTNSGSGLQRLFRQMKMLCATTLDSPNGETGKFDKFLVRRARMERVTRPSEMITIIEHMMATMTTHARTPMCAEAVSVFDDTWVVASGEVDVHAVEDLAPLLLNNDEYPGLQVAVGDSGMLSDSEAPGVVELLVYPPKDNDDVKGGKSGEVLSGVLDKGGSEVGSVTHVTEEADGNLGTEIEIGQGSDGDMGPLGCTVSLEDVAVFGEQYVPPGKS